MILSKENSEHFLCETTRSCLEIDAFLDDFTCRKKVSWTDLRYDKPAVNSEVLCDQLWVNMNKIKIIL